MRKFTTFILLCGLFLSNTPYVSAQNTDINLLKHIYNSSSIAPSQFISNTTGVVALSVPLTLGVVGLIKKDDTYFKDALYVGVSIGAAGVSSYGIKYLIRRPRPAASYPDVIYPNEVRTDYSFPSTHASVAFSTATALSLKYKHWYVLAPSYLWACYVGYSRMNIGVHYPSDVLVGSVLGAGSAYLTYRVNEWYWRSREIKRSTTAWW